MLAKDYKNLKSYLKRSIKNSKSFAGFLENIIAIYLKFVYFTSSIKYTGASKEDIKNFNQGRNIFVCWHNNAALSIISLFKQVNFYALVSPHSDGDISNKVLSSFFFPVIRGSSNQNSFEALRQIVRYLKNGNNIALTPDGPRGPRHKIHSNLGGIAKLAGASVIPIGVKAKRFFSLNSWDKFIIPLPFNKIEINFGRPQKVNFDQTLEQFNNLIENNLNNFDK